MYDDDELREETRGDLPGTVEVSLALPASSRKFVQGLGALVSGAISERMSDVLGDHHPELAGAVLRASAALEAELAPFLEAWLSRTIPTFSFPRIVQPELFGTQVNACPDCSGPCGFPHTAPSCTTCNGTGFTVTVHVPAARQP